MTTDSDEQPIDSSEQPEGERRRFWVIAAIVSCVLAAVALGGLAALLIGAGDNVPDKEVLACVPNRDFTKQGQAEGGKGGHAGQGCPPKGAEHVDGLVQNATDTGFELITIDGEKEFLAVRPADRPYIDVQHAQSHASLGQPVRLYLKEVDGERVIVYLMDSTLDFSKTSER